MYEWMTAAVLVRHGDQDTIEVRDDWPMPVAGEDEVVVQVSAAAVNNTDIWTRQGAYGLPGQPDALAGWRGPISFPRVQGGDIAGVVSAVGPGVPAGLVGRRVLVDPAIYLNEDAQAPPVGLLGSEADGGFAEYIGLRHGDGNAGTSRDSRRRVAPGHRRLRRGWPGVQLAAARGARVVAVTSAAKADLVRAAGAMGVVTRESSNLAGQVAEMVPSGLDAAGDSTLRSGKPGATRDPSRHPSPAPQQDHENTQTRSVATPTPRLRPGHLRDPACPPTACAAQVHDDPSPSPPRRTSRRRSEGSLSSGRRGRSSVLGLPPCRSGHTAGLLLAGPRRRAGYVDDAVVIPRRHPVPAHLERGLDASKRRRCRPSAPTH